MKKKLVWINTMALGLLAGIIFLVPSFTAQAATTQMLPNTGEEIAKTGAIIGGIILVVVVLIIWIRKKKK